MKSHLTKALAMAFVVALSAAVPAAADIYLETNPPIAGSVITAGYEGQIAVDSYQWGAGRSIANCGADVSAISLSEVSITRATGLASMALAQAVDNNTLFTTMTFRFTDTFGGVLRTYKTVVLSNVLVSSYSVSGGGGTPSESFSLNYAGIAVTFDLYDQSGGKSIGSDTFTMTGANCP
jgi:type VI secretion system secreted protein Hcp